MTPRSPTPPTAAASMRLGTSVLALLVLFGLPGLAIAQAQRARLVSDRIELLQPVTFDSTQGLSSESMQVLDAVAAILRLSNGIRLEIGVHTDSTGSAAFNQRRSQQHADAVHAFLVGRGISASRLTAVGYGETRPIDTNSTASGRERNRRVELLIRP